MRPLKLTMTAFGPYAEKTTIDFEKLNNGVYLITGDTGAGKTTIFDAIVFALYGQGSGSGRNSDMFHSDYVDAFTKTEVILEFLCRKKKYRVERTIHYKKKRGGGIGGITKNAVLYYPDDDSQNAVEKETAVNAKITEILGLDEKQFCQIVMLAQGEFKEFLESKSDAREQILGRLFDHRIYVDFQNRLKQAAEELRKSRQEVEREIGFHLSDGQTMEELDNRIAESESQKKHAEENLGVILKESEQLQGKLSIAQMHNQRIRSLKQNMEETVLVHEKISQSQQCQSALDEEYKTCQIHRLKIDELKMKIQTMEKGKHEYEKLNQYIAECDACNAKFIRTKNDLLKLLENVNKETEQKEALETQLETLKNIEVEIEKAKQLLAEQKRKNDLLVNLEKQMESYGREQKRFLKMQDEWKILQKSAENAAEDFLLKNRRFLAGQAGVLANDLRKKIETDGSAECPVCGTSLWREHVDSFAVAEVEIPSQDAVETARKKMDAELQNALEKSKDCEVLKNSLENEKNNIVNYAEEILTENVSWDMLCNREAVRVRREKVFECYRLKQAAMLQLEKKEQLKRHLEKEFSTLKNDLQKQKEKEELLRQICAENERKYVILCNEIKHLKENLAFKSLDAAQKAIDTLKQEQQGLEKILENVEKRREDNLKRISYLHGKQEELQKTRNSIKEQIDEMLETEQWLKEYSMEPVSTEGIENELQELLAQKRALEACREKLMLKLDADLSKKKRVVLLRKELEKNQGAYDKLEKLSAIANGQSREGGKYNFSRYVLGAFFEEIIFQANDHLNRMTGGKYELIRQQEAERKNESAGLGLVVYDAYTGERRGTASLSGGESFQVSLSLALGLSDVVRNHSGGITLDTMFIDEGFGSLDEQALEKAMEVLHELSGDFRQIGIISHVKKLSENIPQKIYVKRSPKGSSIQMVNL